jgi:hypothetical protein
MDWPAALKSVTGFDADPDGIIRSLVGSNVEDNPSLVLSMLGQGAIPGAGGLVIPGSDLSAPRASTPDVAALDIVGDIEVRVILSMIDWTPGGSGTLACKWVEGTSNRSWLFRIQNTGVPIWNWSTTGVNSLSIPGDPTAPVTPSLVSNGGKLGLGVRFDVDNGAAGRTATFITSVDGTNWVALGAPQTTATITTIFSSAAEVSVGGRSDAIQAIQGNIGSCEIRNSIGGTIVANPDFAAQPANTASFADSTGKTWTIQGVARIT